jgi:K+-transporting ATPase ATPase C chain
MQENPGVNESEIPYDMVSYSGSGLDPNIPVQGALLQIPRIIASIHSLSVNQSHTLGVNSIQSFLNETVQKYQRQNFPFFGTYYVNVVALNFAIINMLIDKGVISSSFLD